MNKPNPVSRPGRQKGVALLIVLILLLVMTLLGLASLRGSLMEERMSSSVYDRGIGFQAAEAALREAEALVATNPAFPTSGNCVAGLCPRRTNVADTDQEYWISAASAWRNATVDVNVDNDGAGALAAITTTPQFLVEPLGPGPNWFACEREIPVNALCLTPRFRVTARSAAAGRAQVTLQTTVSTP
ncbi:pilus assembly PilX family protein [Arenimonas sp. MALMAid1274]|uniref:pilus assembly PilX family protein n=1 Tax=Arenimonas sp. MALMAid1274 TaxID=3411630 RepID=UPI003BA3D4CD